MIQYRVELKTGAVSCGEGPLTIDLDDGEPLLNGDTIVQIIVYCIDDDVNEWTLTCNDGPIDDHVTRAMLTAARDSAGQWPSSGGSRWERTNGNLVLKFTGPEPGRDGASLTWDFNPSTPPVHLNIKVRRQDVANDPSSCRTWPE